jgi:anti-anti-sigma factor
MANAILHLIDKDHYQVLSLSGRLDLRSIHNSSVALRDIPLKHTLVDCTNIDFIDSSGLGMITSLQQRLNQNDYQMTLMRVSGVILTVLQRMRLDTLFTFVASEADAKEQFLRAPTEQ